ncbi:MAG: alanine racemase [Chloroflexota bacterium]
MTDRAGGVPTPMPSIEARLGAVGLPSPDRPAWLEVDTSALRDNVAAIRALVGAGTQVWPVVKDDAYGHGLEVASRSFGAAGAHGLCVATLGEAEAVRAAGVGLPVLILYPIPDASLVDAVRSGFVITVSTSHGAESVARTWSEVAPADAPELVAHLEVDTGFTRMGVHPERLAEALAVLHRPGIRLAALWSHLATPEDATTSDEQEARLAAAVALGAGLGVTATHLAASGGLLAGRAVSGLLVRPGLLAYGVSPDDGPPAGLPGAELRAAVRPALRLVARPMRIHEVPTGTRVGYGGTWVAPRPSRIATLPVGYGDGYARASTGADVLVRGRRAPVVGVVSMDACTVDVTDVADVGLDDEFVLLGGQGGDSVPAWALAQRRNTIPWEVLTGMARRLTRVYDAAVGPSGVRTLAGETLVR